MEMTAIKSMPTQSPSLNIENSSITKESGTTSQKPQAFTAQENIKTSLTSDDDRKERLTESTKKFNQMSESLNLDVRFAYNDKIDQVYLNVIDKNTGRIIRKLPSEEAMKISESMKDLVGALLDKKG